MTVKERVKKFYHDHEHTINAFTAGVTVTTIIGLRVLHNTKEGLKPDRMRTYDDKDGKVIQLEVTNKNGKSKLYDWQRTTPL